ncbi:hypothetical protein RRG08_026141 [Elysia crispata]|uniref:Uncharacterized protein n=1 Tax=Elysia crispata TaxID=231223 RepID=A0AAE0ZAD5_9GAST|nr:hypothetical protein RRG08_026141 [Elysia crispata]
MRHVTKARLMKEIACKDRSNFLYFHFAVPIVQELEKVNALFQHTKVDPSILDMNRLQLHTLDAIVRIRSDMVLSNKCCKQFADTPKNMLRRWTSENMYGFESKTSPSSLHIIIKHQL